MMLPMSKSRFYEGEGFIFEHQRQLTTDILPQSFLMYSISVKVDGPSEVEVSCGEIRSRLTLTLGDMTVAPYRFSIDGAYVEPCELLQLHLKPWVVDRAANELGKQVVIVPVLGAVDPLAEQTIYQLEEELTSGRGSHEYVSLLIETLATHLVKYYTETTWTAKTVGGLPRYLLERTRDYIDHIRDRDISIEEIASAVGVEPNRIVRAFKATTGKSLQSYVAERRIA